MSCKGFVRFLVVTSKVERSFVGKTGFHESFGSLRGQPLHCLPFREGHRWHFVTWKYFTRMLNRVGLPPLPLLPPIPLLLLLLQLQEGDPDHIYDKFIEPFCLLFFMGENIHLWDGYVPKNSGHRAESRLILRFAIFFSKNFRCSGIFHTSKLSVLKSGETGPLARRWFERAMNLRLKGFTPLQHGKAEELIFKD